MPDTPTLEDRLKAEAARLGFVQCGIASVTPGWQAGERLHAWIAEGAHGEMGWMEERADQRAHPTALWSDARSAVMLGMSYAPPADPMLLADEADIGRISVYAQGQDYHDIVKKALKALARWLVAQGQALELKVFVDTAPVMEKPLAMRAGLGWQGKHTNVVSREHGSWLLLGAILTNLDLAPDPAAEDRCGSCDACQRICPTQAFPEPYRLDARRCISYLTIEHKGPIPREFREAIGNHVYGCDDCLAICPWNKFAEGAHANRAFAARAELAAPELADLLALDEPAFRQVFAGSPIKRIGRDRMVRNALICAGNSGDEALTAAAERLLDDPAPVVRGAAIWALGKLDPERARAAAWKKGVETETSVIEEWDALRSG
ncbi:tRNA epoxyqueuosine(34) reductase QueG [Sphingomonas sp. AP4-R1]|uniref:tRNA epoxyqueuosine(34) reductase QueG n=1 Tax=Sphingomonas sp. AP4-R1 TaxID=2735134 RepID=UPI001493DA13|nr:tRNA epoxyqueuosine(34) reductase QueG [Sphingomonas sp. AP4-R1]QJU59020.1 tRNA epoxyqueuosine(34) reductase QueG [Sphingomonas sp. AP4-R1]